MFVGHYGVSFACKGARKTIPLSLLWGRGEQRGGEPEAGSELYDDCDGNVSGSPAHGVPLMLTVK